MNTINTLNSIELTQLNQPALMSKTANTTNQPSFASALTTALDKISQLQIQSNQQAKAFEMGDTEVSLNEVMVNMQKSSVSLQFGIQVRNKLVAAYQEIMNMNV